VTSEPDMENLLASIRKAIDSDIGDNTRARAHAEAPLTPLRGTARELRMNFESELAKAKGSSDDILELRNRVNRNRTADAIAQPVLRPPVQAPAATSRTGFAAILAGDTAARSTVQRFEQPVAPPDLRPTLHEREAPQDDYEVAEPPAEDASWGEEEQAYLPVVHEGYGDYVEQPLMSDHSAIAANESFAQLADTVMARALGERSIEDMTLDLLRGMLKNWLDAHLPSLVERLVREEIERVARRGR
jgi:cell pole-organizing protein PopZ